MINSIFLRNFQCHKVKRIDLEPNINVVTGSSDTGKSAIIRAIEWVRTNRPKGTAFVTNGEDSCSVSIRTTKGKVKRFRTKAENGYEVNDETLKAVGLSVPEKASEILNLGDLNVQTQHEPPFLLTKSPGEIGRQLNDYADLSEVDTLITDIGREITRNKHKLEEANKSCKELKESLLLFRKLPEIDGGLASLETMEQQVTTTEKNTKTITNIVNNVISYLRTIKLLKSIKTTEEEMERMRAFYDEKERLETEVNVLSNLLKSVTSHKKLLQIDIVGIQEKAIKARELFNSLGELENNTRSIARIIWAVEQDSQAKKEAEADLSTIPTSALCPTCGQTVLLGAVA